MVTEISRREDKLVYTLVDISLSNNTTVQVEIAHFNPQSEDDIQLGISNMVATQEAILTQNP